MNTANNASAKEVIDMILADLVGTENQGDLRVVKATLEDGGMLAAYGFGDDDQELIENSHALICEMIENA